MHKLHTFTHRGPQAYDHIWLTWETTRMPPLKGNAMLISSVFFYGKKVYLRWSH